SGQSVERSQLARASVQLVATASACGLRDVAPSRWGGSGGSSETPPKFSARGEAAQVPLRAAALGFDPEAGGLDGALGGPGRVAAAHHAGPRRLDPVLDPRLPRAGRAHVLEHPERSAGTEDAPHLGQAAAGLRDTAEGEATDDGVEDAVAER